MTPFLAAAAQIFHGDWKNFSQQSCKNAKVAKLQFLGLDQVKFLVLSILCRKIEVNIFF